MTNNKEKNTAQLNPKPFQLGNVTLPNNVLYSPLAGCSDYPFRMMAAKYNPGIIYCEMVKMDALVRNDPNTYRILDFDKSMHPIGAQIVGSKPELAGQSAKIARDLGFDVIDLNCGCPVDKVTKDGSGSGLMKNPKVIGDIIANMVAAVDIPITVKVRAGWDENSINAHEITEIAEAAGASAIAVHGRTRKQAYRGPANWDYIKACVEAANTIKVIGNGDVFSPEAAQGMLDHTGCDAVLVSRGTMGQPWIAEDILRHREGLPPIERGIKELREALMEHFLHTLAYQNERRVAIDMRRVGCWYIKKSAGTRSFRGLISKASHPDEIRKLIEEFPIGEED
ncbi:MAG: tRNA dihydrouridine synthase DusB [Chlamydiota bacterium]|nr:tRNA dihydrouridine synthase DusB [Chlamydiota bacterium]